MCVCVFFSYQNAEITDLWGKIATAYHVNVVQGILSHQMKQYVLDGNKVILRCVCVRVCALPTLRRRRRRSNT